MHFLYKSEVLERVSYLSLKDRYDVVLQTDSLQGGDFTGDFGILSEILGGKTDSNVGWPAFSPITHDLAAGLFLAYKDRTS